MDKNTQQQASWEYFDGTWHVGVDGERENYEMFGYPTRDIHTAQPEPVNQQMLAALKIVLDDPDALDGRPRTYKFVMESIAAAEAAQTDHIGGTDKMVHAVPVAIDRATIRQIFMAHGFTIKDGQTDLKPYVYEAAEALLRAQQPASAQPVAVQDGWHSTISSAASLLDSFLWHSSDARKCADALRAMLSASQKPEGAGEDWK